MMINMFTFFLTLLKWISIQPIKFLSKTTNLFRSDEISNQTNKVGDEETTDQDVQNTDYYFEFFKFNAVKVTKSSIKENNLKFKLLFERIIMVLMSTIYLIALLIHNNDYAVYYGDITKDFGGLQVGFQLAIFVTTFLATVATFFFNEKPINLKVFDLMQVLNGELTPQSIGLHRKKQIDKFLKFGKLCERILITSARSNIWIISLFFIIFIMFKYSSFDLIIMSFWLFIWIAWIIVLLDLFGRCNNWCVLTFYYILLLIEQLKYDIINKIDNTSSNRRNYNSKILTLTDQLNDVCLKCNELYNFWDKYMSLFFSLMFIANILFVYEFLFGDQRKLFIVKFICLLSASCIYFIFILMYSLISYVTYKKNYISSRFKLFVKYPLNINTRVKV